MIQSLSAFVDELVSGLKRCAIVISYELRRYAGVGHIREHFLAPKRVGVLLFEYEGDSIGGWQALGSKDSLKYELLKHQKIRMLPPRFTEANFLQETGVNDQTLVIGLNDACTNTHEIGRVDNRNQVIQQDFSVPRVPSLELATKVHEIARVKGLYTSFTEGATPSP